MEKLINPPQPIYPPLNPQLKKDLEAWLEAMLRLKMDKEMIKKLAAMLATMKNSMYGIQEVMAGIMQMQGDQIAGLSAVDNVDSDLRSQVDSSQSSFNGIENNNKSAVSEAKNLIKLLDELQGFLAYEKSLGNKSVLDSANIKNLQDAITSIKGAFGESWGNPSAMASNIKAWVQASNKGLYDVQLKTIQDGFQTLNQSTSALSTTTNTQLQFKTEQFKQFLGIDESTIQAYLKLISATINNQKSN